MDLILIVLAIFLNIFSVYSYYSGISPRPLEWYHQPNEYTRRNQRQTQFEEDDRRNNIPPSNFQNFQNENIIFPDFDGMPSNNFQNENVIRRPNNNFQNINNLRPTQRPNNFVWPNNNGNDDFFIFDTVEMTTKKATTQRPETFGVPGGETSESPCEEKCQTTREYNPVCADDGTTYYNFSRLKCALNCGKRITVNHFGRCTEQQFR